MSSVTFSPSVGGDGSTVTDDSNATTGLDGGGHRTRFVPALAQVVAVAAHTVTKAGEASASAAAAAGSASSAADQVGLTTAAGAAQVALAAAHVATASAQATAALTQANNASTSASQASASATSAATSATSAGAAGTAAAQVLISAVTQRPALRPSLSVDWTLRPTAAALTAAGWTISRAGEMTYFDAVPVKVAENLFVQSADFANASWVKNGLVAPAAVTDESGLVGSTVIAAAGAGQHALGELTTSTNLGSQTYRVRFLCKAATYTKAIIADRTTGRAAAAFDLTAGTTIASTFGAGYTSHSIAAHELGGGLYWCNLVMTSAAAGTNWEPTIIGYPDSGATLSATGASYTGDGTSGIEVYAAQLQHNFDGDYVPTTDVPITRYESPLRTAAANELAYQHNSRGECTGLLQYPADTNLILQSQNLGTSPWAGSEVSATVTKRLWAGSAPFFRLLKTTANAGQTRSQAITTSVALNTAYTTSLALLGDRWSATTSGTVELVRGSDTADVGVNGDSTAVIISGPGTLTQSSGARWNITGLSYDTPTVIRVTRTYRAADTGLAVRIYPGSSTSTTLGAAILATRVHLSASPRYMPYIPTTTAAVTRGTQTITLGGSAFAAVNNPVEGTLLARASVEDLVFSDSGSVSLKLGPSAGQDGGSVQLDTASANNVLMGYAAAYGVQQAACISPTVRLGLLPVTSAFSYSSNNFQAAFGGELSAPDNIGIVPPAPGRMFVGGGIKGLVQRTELYPRAMTSAELAAITTPGVLV